MGLSPINLFNQAAAAPIAASGAAGPLPWMPWVTAPPAIPVRPPSLTPPAGQPPLPNLPWLLPPSGSADSFIQTQARRPLVIPTEPRSALPANATAATGLARHYISLGERYYDGNRFQEAVGAYSAAIDLNPQDYIAYNKRGVVRAALKDYPGAMADYTAALSINPDFYNAYINRGNLKYYFKDFNGALSDYGQAIRINPRHNAAYENRAEVYTRMGRRDLAAKDRAIVIMLQKFKKVTPLKLPYCPKRIALVLDNDDYNGNENDLNGGPMRDATAMASVLRTQGFRVMTGSNMTGLETRAKIAAFIDEVKRNPGAITLIYYSGHGGSVNGNNYLIPIDFTGVADPHFMSTAVSVDYLLKELKGTNSLFNMIFLDACRTPLPYTKAPMSAGARASMMRQWETEPGPGMSNSWVEYAARWEQPAMQDNNSGVYTKYLLYFMQQPDLSLKEVAMYTADALEKDPIAIEQGQHSVTQSDLSKTERIAESFYFARPCSPAGNGAWPNGHYEDGGILPPQAFPVLQRPSRLQPFQLHLA